MTRTAVRVAPEERSPRTRTLWVVGDQMLSSLSNFLLGIVVARCVSAESYGIFSVGFALYGLGLGVSRAISTDALVVRFSHRTAPDQREHARAALATSALCGAVLAVGLLAIAAARYATMGPVVIVFAAFLPVLYLQDALRYVCFANRRPSLAFLNDGLWLLSQVLLFILVLRAGSSTAPVLVAIWALSSATGAIVCLRRLRCWPAWSSVRDWVHAHHDLTTRFAAEFLVVNGGTQVVFFVVAALAGLEDVGALRGAYVIMGPVFVIANGLAVAAVPEGSRLRRSSPRRFRLTIWVLVAVVVAVVLAWSVVLSMLGSDLGRALLGDTWPMAQPLLRPLGLAVAGTAAWSVLTAGLRSLEAADASFRASIISMVLLIAGGSIGAVVAGTSGAAVGMVVPAWIGVGIYRHQFGRALAPLLTRGSGTAAVDVVGQPGVV